MQEFPCLYHQYELNPYKANFWSKEKILGSTSNINSMYLFSKLINYKNNISTIIIQQACWGINENCLPQRTLDKFLHICYYQPVGYPETNHKH